DVDCSIPLVCVLEKHFSTLCNISNICQRYLYIFPRTRLYFNQIGIISRTILHQHLNTLSAYISYAKYRKSKNTSAGNRNRVFAPCSYLSSSTPTVSIDYFDSVRSFSGILSISKI